MRPHRCINSARRSLRCTSSAVGRHLQKRRRPSCWRSESAPIYNLTLHSSRPRPSFTTTTDIFGRAHPRNYFHLPTLNTSSQIHRHLSTQQQRQQQQNNEDLSCGGGGELISIHDHLDELHEIPLEDVRNFCIIAHVVRVTV